MITVPAAALVWPDNYCTNNEAAEQTATPRVTNRSHA